MAELEASADDAGKRLDHFLAEKFPEYSRARMQGWVREGLVLVNNAVQKPSFSLRGGERILVTPKAPPPLRAMAEDLPLEVLYEDADVIAVNKASGVIVHAGAGIHSGTLVNALLHRFGTLSQAGGEMRPGIVHRLDRYTSGVLLVARTDAAHRALAAQFAARKVEKVYLALVEGRLAAETGRITAPIARDPMRRTRMTARIASGRLALTEYRVLKRFERFTYVQLRIGTGRTHQIRVHMASIGHPVAGDWLYGARRSPHGRYFLHAHRISFESPSRKQRITVEAGLPGDLGAWLEELS